MKHLRACLMAGTSLAAAAFSPTLAHAQTAAAEARPAAPPATVAEDDASRGGVEEIVVTAQRRAQSLQDVPIAVTAITQSQLASNRIVNVQDLSGLAPNTIVRPAAGGTGIASFSMRGVVSFGVVPGSDKQVSIYLDGVYISSTRASIFDVPDIERIEVLRGPQGTLFGRNATAGAVSIVTREPKGVFGVTQTLTAGNYDQFRSRTTVDLPAWGPFSAYVSYVHNERRGDVRNLGAGTRWDRTNPDGLGVQFSPKYLGDRNSESFFGALKFQPEDNLKMVYKFDWTGDHFTPEANAAIAVNPAGGTNGSILAALVRNSPNPMQFATDGKRPKATNNSFTVPGYQRNLGHSLTTDLDITDNLSLKNVSAYRSSYIYGVSEIGGIGGLVVNAATLADPQLSAAGRAVLAPLLGSRFLSQTTQRIARSQQWSSEFQLNYNSDLLTLTAGAIYFHSKDREGGPTAMRGTFSNSRLPFIPDDTGLVPLIPTAAQRAAPIAGRAFEFQAISRNRATSIAGYAQAEVHVLPTVDLVGGYRLTRDKKSGTFFANGTFNPTTPGSRTDGTITYAAGDVLPFRFRSTEPSYSLGINYKPTNDLLFYGKYSKAFVSGGSIGGVAFEPEFAKSFEAGAKATLLDGRLRTNLALFHVEYSNQQLANSGALVGLPNLGTVVVTLGDVNSGNPAVTKAKGVELELTAVPVDGVTFGGSLGYTDIKIDGTINPLQLLAAGLVAFPIPNPIPASAGANYRTTGIPKYTANLYAQYDSDPVFGDATFNFRVDANWRSRYRMDANTDTPIALFAPAEFTPSQWVVNARASLSKFDLGATKATVALWSRNLFDNKAAQFRSGLPPAFLSLSFQQARTYGIDLTVHFGG